MSCHGGLNRRMDGITFLALGDNHAESFEGISGYRPFIRCHGWLCGLALFRREAAPPRRFTNGVSNAAAWLMPR